jgi:hypothetical protein
MTLDPTQFGAQPLEVSIDPTQFGGLTAVDEEVGAPLRVRTAVGAAAKPSDKLETLKTYYPDARSWGGDNFIYTDPTTGNQTLYNPKGMDTGDVSENARMIFEFLGGTAGGAIAVAAGQLGPQIATPEEIVTVPAAVGVGSAIGGQAYDYMADMFFPNVETRTILEHTAGAGVDVMANAVGQRAGDLLEVAAKSVIAKGSDLAKKGSSEIYSAFQRVGVEPTAGAVSGSKPIQSIENALSNLPSSAEVIGEKAVKSLDALGDYARKLASDVSPSEGREAVGTGIKSGVNKFVKDFQSKGKDLYDKLDEFIPGGTRVKTDTFRQNLNEVVGQFQADPAFAAVLDSPLVKQLSSAMEQSEKLGGMSYQTLKSLRSKIGAAIDDKTLLGDASQAELKRLYGALSDDMAIAASNAGPTALKTFERANSFWAAGRSRIDDVLQPVANKKLNQDIFQSIMSGSKAGSEKLRAFKKSLPLSEWNKVVGQQIRELGMATPGAQNAAGDLFSPATFLTNFNKLGKESRQVLFGGKQFAGLDNAIDDLVTVSAALKEVSKMANTSRTAEQMIYMSILTGGIGGSYGASSEDTTGGAVKGMAIGLLSPYAMAKLITSPKFVTWLADAGRISGNSGIGAHLSRLFTIAEKNQDIAPEIYQYAESLKPQLKEAGAEEPDYENMTTQELMKAVSNE